jgi:hypothetical protein
MAGASRRSAMAPAVVVLDLMIHDWTGACADRAPEVSDVRA